MLLATWEHDQTLYNGVCQYLFLIKLEFHNDSRYSMKIQSVFISLYCNKLPMKYIDNYYGVWSVWSSSSIGSWEYKLKK